MMAEAIDKHDKASDEGNNPSASSTQPSLSMRVLQYGLKKKFPRVNHLSCEELERLRQQLDHRSLVVLDTRSEEEYNVSHIHGALRVDHQQDRLQETVDLTGASHVVCYCSVGYRSSLVADRLQRQLIRHTGATTIHVHNLDGGIFQWAIEQRPMENESGKKSSTVHPYNMFWGKLLPDNLKHSNL